MRFVLLLLFVVACSSPIEYKPCGGRTLSYVAEPTSSGAPCMFDQPLLLYWSVEGITASIRDGLGEWIYYTYTWEEIGVDPSVGGTSYGIVDDGFFFPGPCQVYWRPPDVQQSGHE